MVGHAGLECPVPYHLPSIFLASSTTPDPQDSSAAALAHRDGHGALAAEAARYPTQIPTDTRRCSGRAMTCYDVLNRPARRAHCACATHTQVCWRMRYDTEDTIASRSIAAARPTEPTRAFAAFSNVHRRGRGQSDANPRTSCAEHIPLAASNAAATAVHA